jgi:hypothetical protein
MGTRLMTVDEENKGAVSAPKKAVDSEEVSKKLSNLIENMISVPFQYEFSRDLSKFQSGTEQTV